MIEPSRVSAVLVTKGDHDLSEIYDSIAAAGITDVVTWDNSKSENLSCYGRYEGIKEARNDWIYHQDDDLVAPVAQILEAVDPIADRESIVANNRADEPWLLTAMGVVFHRSLAESSFSAYVDLYGFDDDFCRVSDVIFAYQWSYRRIVLPYRDLAWAATDDRMHLQPDHYFVRERALARVRELTGFE